MRFRVFGGAQRVFHPGTPLPGARMRVPGGGVLGIVPRAGRFHSRADLTMQMRFRLQGMLFDP